ncbi:hypothetical protein MSAN_01386600 [Mycena sanguinolenta]|uniref:Uncharacterized protein n=1 Tax=Mycena sanguinolenta TaxID=230812 RepID=A0A8H6YAA9_9AGAR|nr:hypothetical protein MSAN_01386600 [Mycena sanguinolenta]
MRGAQRHVREGDLKLEMSTFAAGILNGLSRPLTHYDMELAALGGRRSCTRCFRGSLDAPLATALLDHSHPCDFRGSAVCVEDGVEEVCAVDEVVWCVDDVVGAELECAAAEDEGCTVDELLGWALDEGEELG